MRRIVPGDPETRSPDLLAENVRTISALFPEACVEGKIDFEVLKTLLGETVDPASEKFGLHWRGKARAFHLALSPSPATLRPRPEESAHWDRTRNISIIGDNLEALKVLLKSYAGRVNLIYIDPPYNTGKDFLYRDDYSDNLRHYLRFTGQTTDDSATPLSSAPETNGRFHTTWLNMLYPRLRLARDFLTDDGIIFISIDDAEVSNLRTICDEIFGPENLCGVIKRRAARKTAFLSKRMTDMCDYVVIYAKSDQAGPLTAGQIADATRPVFNTSNPITTRVLRAGAIAKCADGQYAAGTYSPRTVRFDTLDDLIVESGIVRRDVRVRGHWRINQDILDRTLFVTRNLGLRRSMLPEERGKPKLLNDLLDDASCYNEKGSEELRSLFGFDAFNNPKPTGLIRHLLRAVADTNDGIVMDFFAGSGTTAHAVMAQNAADGGSRRFILIQLPEPILANGNGGEAARRFCDDLGKPPLLTEILTERLRRAGAAILAAHPMTSLDTGFRLFDLDSANLREWDGSPEKLEQTLLDTRPRIKPDRTEDDLFYRLLLSKQLDLCAPIETRQVAGKTLRAAGGGRLVACLDEALNWEEANAIADAIPEWLRELGEPAQPTAYFRDDAFTDAAAKINLVEVLRQRGVTDVRSL